MRIDWRGALGLALSAALLWWTLRGENLRDIGSTLGSADLGLFLLAAAVCMLIFPLRALRWRSILAPVAGPVSLGPLWRATSIGMMVTNVVVPPRAGELARAYALTREVPSLSFATALGSIAVDRVFDFVVLLLLTFAPLVDPSFPRTATTSALHLDAIARTGVVSVAAILAMLYGLVFFPAQLIRLFELATRRVAPAIERRGATALAAFAEGLGVLRHPGRFATVFLWTLLHWVVQTLSIWIGFRAMNIRVPASASLLLNGVSSFGSVLPAAPGFFGQFELASKLSLHVYGVPDTVAVSWALGYHVLTFIPITIVGMVYAVRIGFSLRDVGRSRNDETP